MQAERVFLGQILLDTSILYSTRVVPDMLSEGNARKVWRSIESLHAQGAEADMVAVKENDPSVDAEYLSEISALAPSAANWRFYEGKILERIRSQKMRRLLASAQESLESSPDEALERIEEGLTEIASDAGSRDVVDVRERALPYIKRLEDRYRNRGQLPGLETGNPDLDDAFMGLQPERLYYIGARPSVGKSALALNMAAHIACEHGIPAGFLSLESGIQEIEDRLHAMLGPVDSQALAHGSLTSGDFNSVNAANEKIWASPLFVYDEPNMRLDQLVSRSRSMVRANGVRVLFVDYLQIINAPGREKRDQVEVASNTLKQLARELHVPVVALAQLRRESDPWWPNLGAFQHSSQAEQDADGAIFIGKHVEETADRRGREQHQLVIAKNRDGVAGVALPVLFEKQYLRFRPVDGAD